jgi:hypothetical protein
VAGGAREAISGSPCGRQLTCSPTNSPPTPRKVCVGPTWMSVLGWLATEGVGFGRWGVGMSTLLLETCFFQSISSPPTLEPSVGEKIIPGGFICLLYGSATDEIAHCVCI